VPRSGPLSKAFMAARPHPRLVAEIVLLACCIAATLWIYYPRTSGRHPLTERAYLEEVAAAINSYVRLTGGRLPVVRGGQSLAEALYPDYFDNLPRLKELLGHSPHGDAYVFLTQNSGARLRDLPIDHLIVVQSGVLPYPRGTVGGEYCIVNDGDSVSVRRRDAPAPVDESRSH